MTVVPPSARIADTLDAASLQALASNAIDVIHVREYFPAAMCAEVAERAINYQAMGFYNKRFVNQVARAHTPFADAHGDPAAESAYHEGAVDAIRSTRAVFDPWLSPMDRLRLELGEYWPGGCGLQQFHGRKCFGGILRVFPPGGAQFHAHYDKIDEETDAPEVAAVSNQFGVNIYLQMPERGGELQLWLREPSDSERRHVRESEGIPHDEVEPAVHTIRPGLGDLVMMSTWRLHAVTPGEGGERVSIGSFVGCYGPSAPLTIWS